MIKSIIIGIITLLVVAAVVAGGVYYWKKYQEPKATEGETEIALSDTALGDIPETTEAEGILAPDIPDENITVPSPEPAAEVEVPVEEAPVDLSPEDISPDIPGTTEEAPQARAISEQPTTSSEEPPRETRPATTEPETRPGETTAPPEQPVEITVEEPTPTPPPAIEVAPTAAPSPIPTTPVVKPTSAPVAAGNYAVRTLQPVSQSQLSTLDKAMKSLGVQLKKEKAGQQRIQATRVAVGYFRTKQEATTWANNNFRPKRVEYFVYQTPQRMFSIQVGVFSDRRNVENKLRELHQKFPGWRLPTRTEPISMTRSIYYLSVRGITETLARKVQDALFGMRIPAELSRI